MRELTIDQELFNTAFERDVDYDEQDSLNAYLDLETGGVEWVYDEDHDAEMYGLMPQLLRGDPDVLASEQGKRWYDMVNAG